VCKSYIKFLNKEEKQKFEQEEDTYDDMQAMRDQELADEY
jgi:hypothetical protein